MRIEPGFTQAERPAVAALYWQAFGPKLGRILGPEARALVYIGRSLSPDHALCARDAVGRMVGVAGFRTRDGSLVDGHLADMVAAYGPLGALVRAGTLALLDRDVDNRRFLVDGLFVAAEDRGQGIGSRLIEALAQEARARGYSELRLDVASGNPRARALYERRGFAAVETRRIGALSPLLGIASTTTMVRRLS